MYLSTLRYFSVSTPVAKSASSDHRTHILRCKWFYRDAAQILASLTSSMRWLYSFRLVKVCSAWWNRLRSSSNPPTCLAIAKSLRRLTGTCLRRIEISRCSVFFYLLFSSLCVQRYITAFLFWLSILRMPRFFCHLHVLCFHTAVVLLRLRFVFAILMLGCVITA